MLSKEFYNLKLNIMKKGFVAIAMKCNQEQFDAVKSKLEDYRTDYINNFNEYPYLTNYLQNGNQVANCTDFFAKNNPERHELHETWNEKIFLEACGIETIPTLEEVKEYFKNAEKCESSLGSEFKMSEYNLEGIRITASNAIGVDRKKGGKRTRHLYDFDSKKWAKILTYKEPKEESFTITKEQIQTIEADGCTYIKEWFPKAFEPEKKELVVGNWYKKLGFGKFKFCFNGSYGQMSQYGFDRNGYWSKELGIYECEEYIEATQQEVEETLKAEILKRYKVGDLVYLLDSKGGTKKLLLDKFKYYPKNNKMFVRTEDNRMAKMFDNGIFAEIIQPKKMTQAEIETELGYLIEIV